MKIGIDPGHGLGNAKRGVYDPGAVAGGIAEADIALLWALTGKFVLTKQGYKVWVSRDEGTPAPLSRRAERAKTAQCDLLISIHCNAASDATANGTEVIYRSIEGKALSEVVLAAALETIKLRNRGVKHEGQTPHKRLAILDFNPSCLLELGFITNTAERVKLQDRENRIAFWESLAQRLRDFRLQ